MQSSERKSVPCDVVCKTGGKLSSYDFPKYQSNNNDYNFSAGLRLPRASIYIRHRLRGSVTLYLPIYTIKY